MKKADILFPVTLDIVREVMLDLGSGLRFERKTQNGLSMLVPTIPTRRGTDFYIVIDDKVMKATAFVSIGQEGDINKAHNWNMYRMCGVVGLTTHGYSMKHAVYIGGGVVAGTLLELVRDFMEHIGEFCDYARSNDVDLAPKKLGTPTPSLVERVLSDVGMQIGSKTPHGFVRNYIARCDDVDLNLLTGKPSWFPNRIKLQDFFGNVIREAALMGISDTYVAFMMHGKETQNLIFSCVAEAEAQEFDDLFQKQVAVAIAERGWERLADEQKDKLRSVPLSSLDEAAFK